MPTFRDDGGFVRLLADDAREGNALEQLLVLFVFGRAVWSISIGRGDGLAAGILALRVDLPVAVELPALLVVFSRVQEFAAVAEAAEACLFVVLAHVGSKVCHRDGSHVARGFDGSDLLGCAVGVFLYEGLVVGHALVCPIGCFYICRLGGRRVFGVGFIVPFVVPI